MRSVLLTSLGILLCGLVTTASDPDPARWRWSNPQPHGNNVLDMMQAGDWLVQVGDAGQVHLQLLETGRWLPTVTGVAQYLRGVAFLGNRLIVVGESGTVLWSDDGETFHPGILAPPTTDWFEGVATSSERAVAVGDNGSVYSTTNGVDWVVVNSGSSAWLRSVTYGNNRFVAVGEEGALLVSPQGLEWTAMGSGTPHHLNRVRYFTATNGEGTFMAVGDAGTVLSGTPAAMSWTPVDLGITNALYDVAANLHGMILVGDGVLRLQGPGLTAWADQLALVSGAAPDWTYLSACATSNRFCVAGRSGFMVSGRPAEAGWGLAWQDLSDSSHAWLWDVTAGDGVSAAVGDLATILTSLDGIVWASEASPFSATNTVLLGVGGTSNLLVAAGSGGALAISEAGWTNLTVTNWDSGEAVLTEVTLPTLGTVWTSVPDVTTNTLQGVASGHGLHVITGNKGTVLVTTNGTNWARSMPPTSVFLSGVAAYPGGWVAVGQRGTVLRAPPDAQDWEPVTVPATTWIYRVRWCGDRLVAVGEAGLVLTSPDGATWSRSVTGAEEWLNDVSWLAGTWFAVGTQGTLLATTDLLQWTRHPLPTGKSLLALTSREGRLLVTGTDGLILRNRLIVPESPVEVLAYSLADDATGTTGGANVTPDAGVYHAFLFGGEPDQVFGLESRSGWSEGAWCETAHLELFDPGGILYYLLPVSDLDITPQRFFRTRAP